MEEEDNTLEISEILEPLHNCLRECIERDDDAKGHLMIYTDADVVAATLMFSHVLGNRMAHKLTNMKSDQASIKKMAQDSGERIRLITKHMSGVNLAEYYKRK